jgi:signal transduction histidine kinase
VIGFCAVGLAALAVQAYWPYLGVAAMIAGNLLAHSWGGAATPYLVGMGLALERLAALRSRRTVWLTGCAVAAVYLGAVATGITVDGSGGDLVWAGMMLAIGDAARSRREVLTATQERAERAEQTRELEASKAVAEERLRIARDVHDSIGHHLSVIAVHSAVAEQLFHTDTDEAQRALSNVRKASVTILDELTGLVNALRGAGERSETDPPIGVEGISGLAASFGAAGMRVRTRIAGIPQPLPLASSQAAYRIVQESLTNATKHSRQSAVDLSLRYGPNGMVVRVSNPFDPELDSGHVAASRTALGGRNGIIGMVERAHNAGGALTAQEIDGNFVVTAVLPYSRAERV